MKQLENVLVSVLHVVVYQQEGPEGVKWELGFAYSWPGNMRFLFTGTGTLQQ
jgi:hypothetical protein